MNKKMFNTLVGESIYFKPINIDDALEIHEYASDENVSKSIGWKLAKNVDDTREIIRDILKKEESGFGVYASIVLKNSEKIIGTCMVFDFNLETNNAEVGYVLNAKHWNKGYGSEMISLINDYALKELKLHKLHAYVTDTNIGSSKILEKNGFKLEGHFRDYYVIDDKYYDGLFFGKILD